MFHWNKNRNLRPLVGNLRIIPTGSNYLLSSARSVLILLLNCKLPKQPIHSSISFTMMRIKNSVMLTLKSKPEPVKKELMNISTEAINARARINFKTYSLMCSPNFFVCLNLRRITGTSSFETSP